jgi:hypothetical protein
MFVWNFYNLKKDQGCEEHHDNHCTVYFFLKIMPNTDMVNGKQEKQEEINCTMIVMMLFTSLIFLKIIKIPYKHGLTVGMMLIK